MLSTHNNRSKFLLIATFAIFGYVFFADFFSTILGLHYTKLVCALFASFCGGTFCILQYSRLSQKKFLIIPFIILILYVYVFHSTTSLSYFYTSILAFLLVQNTDNTKKLLDFVFIIQFILCFYELFNQQILYTTLSTGLFNIQEIEFNTKYFYESGFRAKGLFTGCLEATAFSINYSIIFRNNLKRTFWAFFMAIILNGRMAMIITVSIFLYNLIICARRKGISKVTIKTILIIVAISISSILSYLAATSLRVGHLLSVFNPTSDSFKGRTERYGLAWLHYLNVYNLPKKIFVGEYELYDHNNMLASAESDCLGMLLDIGLFGFCYILFFTTVPLRKEQTLIIS